MRSHSFFGSPEVSGGAVNEALLDYFRCSKGLGNPLSSFFCILCFPFPLLSSVNQGSPPSPLSGKPNSQSHGFFFSRDSLVTLGIADGHGPPLLEWGAWSFHKEPLRCSNPIRPPREARVPGRAGPCLYPGCSLNCCFADTLPEFKGEAKLCQ